MKESWKKYEQLVFDECERVYDGALISSNVLRDGRYSKTKRQIDILVEGCVIDGNETSIMFDAKCYSKKVDVKCVESFISMLDDVAIPYGIIVTNKGFSDSAIRRAHIGTENVQVDILSMKDLKFLQSPLAIPYQDRCGIILRSPFGWIVDGKQRGGFLATLYQRGLSFEEATSKKEWMYINFVDKTDGVSSIPMLIKLQNQEMVNYYGDKVTIKIDEKEGIPLRTAYLREKQIFEVTAFKDFGKFIVFIVLFTLEDFLKRDISKLYHCIDQAIPLYINEIIEENNAD